MKKAKYEDAGAVRACRADVSQMNAYLQAGMRTASFRGGAGLHRTSPHQNSTKANWTTSAGFDCHFVPQSAYLNGTDIVFCAMAPLRRYLIEKHWRAENVSKLVGRLHEFKSHTHALLDEATRPLAHKHYQDDFLLCGGFKSTQWVTPSPS